MFKHPELQEGEVFLGNITTGEAAEADEFLPYISLRLGAKPYDIDTGNPSPDGYVPVFVNEDELKEKGRYLIPNSEIDQAITKLKKGESFYFDVAFETSEDVFAMLTRVSDKPIFRSQISLHRWLIQPSK